VSACTIINLSKTRYYIEQKRLLIWLYVFAQVCFIKSLNLHIAAISCGYTSRDLTRTVPIATMHLSTNLKMLIDRQNSSSTHTSEQPSVRDQFSKVEQEANARELSLWTWLAILTATAVTMNSAESMIALFHYTMCTKSLDDCVAIAEFMREIGLRCIGINGVRMQLCLICRLYRQLTNCPDSTQHQHPGRVPQITSILHCIVAQYHPIAPSASS
jgi:hypothetical protein